VGVHEVLCTGRLRITDRQASYLMDGVYHFDLLEKRGCQPLPTNERQNRSLSLLKKDDLKVLAWNRACQQKQGSHPHYKDVMREVRRLLGNAAPSQESDPAYREYRKLLGSAQSRCKKAHGLLEEGDMDGFLVADDKATKKQKARLVAMIGKLTPALGRDALILQGEEVEPDAEPARDFASRSSPLPDLLSFRCYGEASVLPVPAY
jgi:hypothetical protein